MITLLLGTDILAKKQYVQRVAAQKGAEVQIITDASLTPKLGELFEQQLFGAPKIVVFDHVWKNLDPEELLKNFADNKFATVFIIEDSLDKRKKVNQDFQKDARVTVIQLDSPIGTQAVSTWILKYAKEQGIVIEPQVSMALAQALLIDEDATLDVVRAQNEIQKLKQYAAGEPVTPEMVALLVESSIGVDIFDLLNAIATRNKKVASHLLNTFFETEKADEKTSAIKITSLLADQFRSLLIVADADNRNMPDDALLQLTGWKSGRLYIVKKLARSFKLSQIKQALSKLENLDRELKTNTMPPHVILNLIIADL